MDEIVKKGLGFFPRIFGTFQFPRRACGNTYEVTINGLTCIYYSDEGVPHSMNDRRWFEIVATLSKRSKKTTVYPGSVQTAMLTYGMGSSGFYIKPAVASLKRIVGLTATTKMQQEGTYKGRIIEAYRSFSVKVAKASQILWGKGRGEKRDPELDGMTFIELTQDFYDHEIAHASPHIQSQFLKIQSPLEQDLYLWLVSKLYNMRGKSQDIPWTWLFAQFYRASSLKGDALQNAKNAIKNALLKIRRDFYPKALFDFYYWGIRLMNSPPLIEPESKGAGFSPGGFSEDDGADDFKPLDIHWSHDKKNYTIGDE